MRLSRQLSNGIILLSSPSVISFTLNKCLSKVCVVGDMSGPNGDPNISADDGIIDDEDEFNDEGNHNLALCWFTNIIIV